MKGGLTIEAAWILPFCFAVIGIICCLGVYEYDCAVLKMIGCGCVLEASDSIAGNYGEKERELLETLREQAEAGTLALKNIEVTMKKTNTKILVTYRAVSDFFEIPVEVSVVYERVFPELFLRMLE